MSRLTQILRGKKIKPLTEMESAVKYAIDNAGSGGGSSLPAVTSDDNGDLLGVVEGAWGKVDPPAELPAVSSADNGSLLGVSDGAWAKVAAPTELPAVTGADNGDMLRVVEGAWAKANYPLYKVPVTVTESDGVYSASTTADYSDAISKITQQTIVIFAQVTGLSASNMCIIPAGRINTAGASISFDAVLNLSGTVTHVGISWAYTGDMSITVTPLETTT